MDLFNLASKQEANIQVITEDCNWIKPDGISMVFIFAAGGGGGGGGGWSALSSANRGGGGGGAGGTISKLLVPAKLIPDTLKINIGVGGIGGGPSAFGTAGTATTIDLPQVNNGAAGFILNAFGGNAGLPGSGTAGGNGATTTSAPSFSSMILGGLGNLNSSNSPTGANGGAVTPSAGANATLGTTYGSFVSGGAGGGGASSAGLSANGGIVTITSTPPTYQTVTGGTTTSVNGSDGFFKFQPMFYSMGGGGGFGNGTGVGGNGGNGGNGSGGGGGGAGTTGGSGGKGGDGLVVIVCW